VPTYVYLCKCGRRLEKVCRIVEHTSSIPCECGKSAGQIIEGGFTLRDADIPWMSSAAKVMQRHNERPVETRQEWKKYQKDNGLVCVG
jgi:hypothetical protein